MNKTSKQTHGKKAEQVSEQHPLELVRSPRRELTLEELSRVTGGVNQPRHHE